MALGTAIAIGMGVAGAATSVMGGYAQGKESDANAELYQQKAQQIDVAKGIEKSQYARAKRQVAGTTIARTAKANIGFGGSPLAVFIDTQAQMEMDEAVGQYNFEIDKQYNIGVADAYTKQASRQRTSGILKGFTSLMMMGSSLYTPKPSINTSGYAWKSLGTGSIYST